ncbi:MAG: acetyl-CoA carboxylase biotin carboxyl carrier protein [Candidatus Obscuribacterales bacterium]|nr:acetyl-CoA carboxylase biotin carboxyl carrier protein [Candidatus Obscuribacterales bacterium]
MKIDLNQIRELLSVVSQTDITELTLEFGDQKITIKKNAVQIASASIIAETPMSAQVAHNAPAKAMSFEPAPVAQSAPPPKAEEPVSANNGYVAVTSPMVGTFYRAASPTAAPFVDIGDRISVGQTVCIIEAMKLMNDMPAEVAGKIVKVCVDNGTTVEYGQTLFLVDPKG